MKNNLLKKRKKCRLCDSTKVKQVLSMPSSQPVDNFRPFFDPEINLPLFDINKRQALRQTILDDFAMEKDDNSFPMKPQKILWEVREFLDPSDILLSDVDTMLFVCTSKLPPN